MFTDKLVLTYSFCDKIPIKTKIKINNETTAVYFNYLKHSQANKYDERVFINIPRGKNDPNFFSFVNGEVKCSSGGEKTLVRSPRGRIAKTKRITIKPGKVINLLKDLITNSYGCEITCNKIKTRWVELITSRISPINFNVLVSDDIDYVYNIPTSENVSTGTLNSSCMNHEARKDGENEGCKFLYNYNTIKNLKIAYALDLDGDLIARALLWFDVVDDITGKKFNFMDRIYGNEKAIIAFKEFAKQNGYLTKEYQSYDHHSIVDENENVYSENFSLNIDLHEDQLKGMPYMDTFRYFVDGVLYTKEIKGHPLQNCSGGFRKTDCPSCGEIIYGYDGVLIKGEYICNNCLDTKYRCCDHCYKWILLEETSLFERPGYFSQWLCKDCYNEKIESSETQEVMVIGE